MGKPRHERLSGRAAALQRLSDDGHTAKVRAELQNLWAAGTQPAHVRLRHGLVARRGTDDVAPLLVRLIRSHGVALRLLLLMIFEAQCRCAPGQLVTSVRSISPLPDDERPSWVELLASNVKVTAATGRGALQLRHRQIKEAMRLLHAAGAVELDRDAAGRLLYDDCRLLEETGRTVPPHYVVPLAGFYVDRRLFTEMWIFALTDAELATYFALCALRSSYPGTHETHGVFAIEADRKAKFGLTRDVYEAHLLLSHFGLLKRHPDPWRHPDGKVVGFSKRTAPLKPHRFTVLDGGLAADGFMTIIPELQKEAVLAKHEFEREAAVKAADQKDVEPATTTGGRSTRSGDPHADRTEDAATA